MKLRERIIGLPLQRSVFDRLTTAGELVGLGHALPDGFRADLDATGSLHVSSEDARALRAAFPRRPGRGFVTALEGTRRSVCAGLLEATRAAESLAPAGDDADCRRAAIDLLARLADFMPYPILTKIVPELLLGALDTDESPIEAPPSPSPGLQLTLSLERLAAWCADAGWSAERLAAAWPDVPPHVGSAVLSFCAAHSGFGPVAWEAPGFDSPEFTLRALAGVARPGSGEPPPPAPTFADLAPDPHAHPMTTAGALSAWLELTDHQIWYVRTAFFRGLVPLLRSWAGELSVAPRDMLFVTRHELAGELPDIQAIDERRNAYWADTGYLERNSVAPHRLDAILGDSYE